ncbi:MAG: efflux transporter outer membrane subunit [Parafilimonas terrae]|nr:efflux transporter outer membrane subunit [Parafilimonas terrae]
MLLATVSLAGCQVGPTFEPPVVAAPAAWGPTPKAPSRPIPEESDPDWWQAFRDPLLTDLIERLAAQNLDLKAATERVVQGAAQREVVASRGLPHIEGQSIDFYNRTSRNSFSTLFQPAPGAPQEFPYYQQGLQMSWELDLFGRVRRAVEAQDANTLAAVENRNGVALAAMAELAQSYVQVRGVQARIAVAQRNLVLARENIALVETRFANGAANNLDRAQARSQEAMIEQTLPPLRTQEASMINTVGFLLGEAPRALEGALRPPKALPRLPRSVAVGLPMTLLRRRPDIREAEARLRAAVAETGAAEAEFYPDIDLLGTINVQSLRLSDLFTLPSRAFNVGPNISIPIFEGGRLRGNLALRESQQREAAIAFQRTVLRAWQETDNALTAYAETQRRALALIRAVEQNQIALQAARQRYVEGLVDFLNVNTTHAQLLQSQNELADSHTQAATALVTLYRALGGGWQLAALRDVPAGRGRVLAGQP